MMPIVVITPREEGAIAVFEGKAPADNPYSPYHPEYDDWLFGYESEVEFISENFDACFGPAQGTA
jgi:hypothetical protein